jgi:RNase H-fold protein (predicted Holliday junction resolvase)
MMADDDLNGQELSYKIMNESTRDNTDIELHCINCEKLKLELKQARLEIASYAEIVRMMQQESSPDPSSTAVTKIGEVTEYTEIGCPQDNSTINSKWSLAIQKKQKKKVKVKDSEKCTTVLDNKLISTANKFTPLMQTKDQQVSLPRVSDKSSTVRRNQKSCAKKDVGYKIPTLVNGEIVISEVRQSIPRKADIRYGTKKHKVIINGDSHLRDCAVGTNQFLNTTYSVSSLIKPGATACQIIDSQENECKSLGKNDVMVISAGSNDIDSNSDKVSDVLCKMTKFMQNNNTTNIVIVGIPYRHDVEKNSQINTKIRELNNKLKDKGKLFNHVSFIETDRDKENYTRHGFHLNRRGKERLARQLAKQIIDFTKKGHKEIPIMALAWKDNLGRDTPMQLISDLDRISIEEGNDKIQNRCSLRKKTTINRNSDFLWL